MTPDPELVLETKAWFKKPLMISGWPSWPKGMILPCQVNMQIVDH